MTGTTSSRNDTTSSARSPTSRPWRMAEDKQTFDAYSVHFTSTICVIVYATHCATAIFPRVSFNHDEGKGAWFSYGRCQTACLIGTHRGTHRLAHAYTVFPASPSVSARIPVVRTGRSCPRSEQCSLHSRLAGTVVAEAAAKAPVMK